MLIQRDVIRYGDETGDVRDFRVIWSHAGEVVLFDLAATDTRVARRARDEVVAELMDGTARIVSDHAYDLHPNPARLTTAQKNRQNKLMGLIGPLLERAPDIFDDKVRGRAIAGIERRQRETTDREERKQFASAKTLHQAFDRYWRRGMSVNALTPSFEKCGVGKRKPGATKLGAPVTVGMKPGVNVTKDIEAIFEKGLQRYYVSKRNARRKISLKAAYDLMVGDFFLDTTVDEVTGKLVHPVKEKWAETGYPSFRQFRFWYDKRSDLLGIRRKREGNSRYDKDMRGIVGTAVAGVMGAGSRFEIDSTPLDIGCVSEIDRTVPVKRPTFYQVTDVLTKLICGIYVGYENASWMAAGLAVRNVVEDKVAFCERYGVAIDAGEWPVQGVQPARYMSDRGEWEGYDATGFVAKSTVTVELAAPYRGDQKGSGEKRFDMFHRLLRTQLDGMIEKKVRERGDRDYRRDAILTLPEVTACVIHVALHLNNTNKLTDYPRTREMVAERVRAIPVEMWQWCRVRGMDELSRVSVPQIEFALLPVGQATVTQFGYKFRDLYYKPRSAAEQAVFDHARQKGVSKVDVSWDPLWTTHIWLHDPKADVGHVVLGLTDRSIEFSGISFDEWAALRRDDRVHTANYQPVRHAGLKRAADGMKAINSAANAQRPRQLSASEAQGSKANGEEARRRERASRAPTYRAANDAAVPLSEAIAETARKPSTTDWQNRQSDYLG